MILKNDNFKIKKGIIGKKEEKLFLEQFNENSKNIDKTKHSNILIEGFKNKYHAKISLNKSFKEGENFYSLTIDTVGWVLWFHLDFEKHQLILVNNNYDITKENYKMLEFILKYENLFCNLLQNLNNKFFQKYLELKTTTDKMYCYLTEYAKQKYSQSSNFIQIETEHLFDNQYNINNNRIFDNDIIFIINDVRENLAGRCGYCGTVLKYNEKCNKNTKCSDYKINKFFIEIK